MKAKLLSIVYMIVMTNILVVFFFAMGLCAPVLLVGMLFWDNETYWELSNKFYTFIIETSDTIKTYLNR